MTQPSVGNAQVDEEIDTEIAMMVDTAVNVMMSMSSVSANVTTKMLGSLPISTMMMKLL